MTDLESTIFNTMRITYGDKLQKFWDSTEFPKISENTVLLIESDENPNVDLIIKIVMFFTKEKGFSLTIVCSQDSEEFFLKLVGKHVLNTHVLAILKKPNNDPEEYNKLLTDSFFWGRIRAVNILLIHSKCYLRKPLPEILWTGDFCSSYKMDEASNGRALCFINKLSAIDMCKRSSESKDNADLFFKKSVLSLGKKRVHPDIEFHIFIEHSKFENPCGVSNWWHHFFTGSSEDINKYFKIYSTLMM
jgi:hypothetical protein